MNLLITKYKINGSDDKQRKHSNQTINVLSQLFVCHRNFFFGPIILQKYLFDWLLYIFSQFPQLLLIFLNQFVGIITFCASVSVSNNPLEHSQQSVSVALNYASVDFNLLICTYRPVNHSAPNHSIHLFHIRHFPMPHSSPVWLAMYSPKFTNCNLCDAPPMAFFFYPQPFFLLPLQLL